MYVSKICPKPHGGIEEWKTFLSREVNYPSFILGPLKYFPVLIARHVLGFLMVKKNRIAGMR